MRSTGQAQSACQPDVMAMGNADNCYGFPPEPLKGQPSSGAIRGLCCSQPPVAASPRVTPITVFTGRWSDAMRDSSVSTACIS